MKRIPPLKQQTIIYPKRSDDVVYLRRISKSLALGRILLAAFIVLSASYLYGQESDDALFIDKDGNVTGGKKLKAKKLEGDGSSLTVKALEGDKSLRITEALAMLVPIGTIMAYGGDVTKPEIKRTLEDQGWLPCDGAKKEVSNYRNLHDIIGNAFGGDGNNFYLPDMRGRFLRGVNYGATDNVGGKEVLRDPDVEERKHPIRDEIVGGRVGSVQEDAFESHNHEYQDRQKASTANVNPHEGAGGGYWNTHTGYTGGSVTRPKNIYVNWIIKAKHIIRTRQ